MVTFEEYLTREAERGHIDHALRASISDEGRVTFYVHPMNADGDTRDYLVSGNSLRANPAVTRMDEAANGA